jgi:hypothetical protein
MIVEKRITTKIEDGYFDLTLNLLLTCYKVAVLFWEDNIGATLLKKEKELIATLSLATAPRYMDTCNHSATNTYYTHYDNL